MLFHAVLTLPYKTIPDNIFNTGLYVQTSDSAFINYVACAAVVSTTGYYWAVIQATGPALGAVTTTNLWTSPMNTMPLTQDCTIITNGNNYLKVYLGGNVVYQSSSLMLNMPSPFNAFLEVQTNSASAMRFGSYLSYYATLSEDVTVTNAPPGGTVKIVDSLNNLPPPVDGQHTGLRPPQHACRIDHESNQYMGRRQLRGIGSLHHNHDNNRSWPSVSHQADEVRPRQV
jgi:hypothetical protein